jgi:DNA (cytosine-5)-methyltransferase 1
MSARIGSLFSGTGALDIAVMDVLDAEMVWHSQYEPPDKNGKEDKNQYAAKILARHWPDVPNLGDITKVDWQHVLEEYGPVDILTGGFPCQDVSSAGRRAGLTADSRSGLWAHYARAIHELKPRLVVIENVEGLLSAPADRGLGSDAEALGKEARAGRILRALGAVLGDLATLGLHAEWERVAASDVGAPHVRKRVIIYAWPADADPADLRHQRCGGTRFGRPGPADGDLAAPDANGRGLEGHQERDSGPETGQPERQRRLDALGRGVRREAPDTGRPNEALADAEGDGRDEGRPEPARQQGRPDASERGGTTPTNSKSGQGRLGNRDDVRPRGGADGRQPAAGRSAAADADHVGRRADVLDLRPGQPDLDWGDYGPAIRGWEAVLGRSAPWPTDALGRLSAVFTEWLMGLPDGWVTDTPGLTRSAMLRALGNGVVWQQAAYALRLLHDRAAGETRHPVAA